MSAVDSRQLQGAAIGRDGVDVAAEQADRTPTVDRVQVAAARERGSGPEVPIPAPTEHPGVRARPSRWRRQPVAGPRRLRRRGPPGTLPIEAEPQEVEVGVDEARDHRPTFQVDPLGTCARRRQRLGGRADGDDPVTDTGERLSGGRPGQHAGCRPVRWSRPVGSACARSLAPLFAVLLGRARCRPHCRISRRADSGCRRDRLALPGRARRTVTASPVGTGRPIRAGGSGDRERE